LDRSDPKSVAAFLYYASNKNFELGGTVARKVVEIPWRDVYSQSNGGQHLMEFVLKDYVDPIVEPAVKTLACA